MTDRTAPTPATVAATIPARDAAQLRAAYEAALQTVRALAPLVDTTDDTAQTTTAETLARLTREDAPAVDWALPDDGRSLEGQLFGEDDDERRRGLAAWQRVIGAGPVQAHSSEDHLHLRIHGSYEGLAVKVVTLVAAEGAPEAVAA
jgi:hypothetical protein